MTEVCMHACAPIDVRTLYVFGQRCRSRYNNNNVQPFRVHLNYISNEPFANESGEIRCQSQRVWCCRYIFVCGKISIDCFSRAQSWAPPIFFRCRSNRPPETSDPTNWLFILNTVPRSTPSLTAGAVCRTCMTSRAFFSASTIDDR